MKETIVEQQVKISKLERQGANGLSNLPKAATPAVTADTRELDNPEDRNAANVPTKTTTRLENERLADAAQCPPLVESISPALPPGAVPEALLNTRLEEPKEPKEVKDENPVSPQPQPLLPLRESDVPPVARPKKPNHLRERKKVEATPPIPVFSSRGGNGRNSQNIPGDPLSGWNHEPASTPTTTGDRQSAPTEATPGRKREKRREDIVDGFSGSNPSERNDSTQPNITTKPAPVRALPRKSSGWGSWGAAKIDPTPTAQKASTGPAWGVNPTGGIFGSRGTGRGSGTGSTFGGGVGENLPVDTATKPIGGSPTAAGPDEEAGDTWDYAWGSGEAIRNKASKKDTGPPSPTREKEPVVPGTTAPRESWFFGTRPVKKDPAFAERPPEYRFMWGEVVCGSRPDPSWRPTTTR